MKGLDRILSLLYTAKDNTTGVVSYVPRLLSGKLEMV